MTSIFRLNPFLIGSLTSINFWSSSAMYVHPWPLSRSLYSRMRESTADKSVVVLFACRFDGESSMI